MTQKEFIAKLAAKLQWDESKTSAILSDIVDVLTEQLSDNNVVTVDNFGHFSTHKFPEYILVDAETKDRYLMPPEVVVLFEQEMDDTSVSVEPKLYISFEIDDSFKSSINSAFTNFEPTLLNEGVELPGIDVISTKQPEEDVEEIKDEAVPEIEKSEIEESLVVEEYDNIHESEVEETDISDESSEDTDDYKDLLAETSEDEVVASLSEYADTETEPDLNLEPMPQDLPEPLLVRQRTTFPEHQSEQVLQSGRSPKSRSRSHKSSRVFVPILGGVVIVMATLFFFNGVANRKKTNKRKGHRG
jgi:nucleoid DNA-binding protein